MNTEAAIAALRRYNEDAARLRRLTAEHEALSGLVLSWTYSVRRLLGRNTTQDRVDLGRKDREIAGLLDTLREQAQALARLEAETSFALTLPAAAPGKSEHGLTLASLRILRRFELEGAAGEIDFARFARDVHRAWMTLEARTTAFVTTFQSLRARHNWGDGTTLRFAALALVNSARDPDRLEQDFEHLAFRIRTTPDAFQGIDPSRRYLLASALLRREGDPDALWAQVAQVDLRLGSTGLSSGYHRMAAALVLTLGCPTEELLQLRARRIPRLLALMKEHHFWLTGKDDYPMAAVLSALPAPIEDTIEKVERIYRELSDWGFKTGNALQTTSHLLALSELDSKRVVARFTQVWKALTAGTGVPKDVEVFDETALLTLLPGTAEGLVDLFGVVYERIRKELPMGGGKEAPVAVSLATALLKWALFDDRDYLEEALVADVHRYAELTIREVEVAAAVSNLRVWNAGAS